ncbi:hypothetical protein JCM31598_21900 [Desulfonatronum parangueonense]
MGVTTQFIREKRGWIPAFVGMTKLGKDVARYVIPAKAGSSAGKSTIEYVLTSYDGG